jgi:trigger factor
MIGMKKGQAEQIKIKMPDDYHAKKLAGEEVVFSVLLKNIKEKILPEIDEKFIHNFDKYETLDDLKRDIRKTLEEENIARLNSAFKNQIIDKLLEKNEFEVPLSFVNRQISYMIDDMQRRMATRGIKRQETSELYDKFYQIYKDEAKRIVRTILLMKSMAEKESITVSEQEINEKIKEIANQRAQSYDSLRKSLEDSNLIEDIKNEIINTKLFAFIEDKAKVIIAKK